MTLKHFSSISPNDDSFCIPDLPEEYLDILLIENPDEKLDEIVEKYPFALSNTVLSNIINSQKLTNGNSVKEIYLLELENTFPSFNPGDTIGIIPENRGEDIEKLFTHLGISNLAKIKCKVIKKLETLKKNQQELSFINKVTTLYYIFKHCIDIQCVPRKSFIRMMVEHTTNSCEKSQLKILCSKEGSDLYIKQVLESQKTILDLILMFKSCKPPVERLLEHLPKLLPRPYSIASSPLESNKIRIVFSVINDDQGCSKGLCTGLLKNLIEKKNGENPKVKMYLRQSNGFNLPEDTVPIILIGPGTGVAPFLGFLEHRKKQNKPGKIWLFYGCRHKTQDYIFKEELNEYLNSGVLSKLSVAFSRDGDDEEPKYVQDNLKAHGREITDLIIEENALIYVCGDGKNMRKEILNTFSEILQTQKKFSSKESSDFLKKLQKDKRYLQDIWI